VVAYYYFGRRYLFPGLKTAPHIAVEDQNPIKILGKEESLLLQAITDSNFESMEQIAQRMKSPVSTVCSGLAASMGSILLSAGAKGRRFMQPHAQVMIHQPSGGARGQASNIEIQAREIIKTRELSAQILADNCGQKVDKVMKDFDRDYWMNAEESLAYGIVDAML
jgi:ATP-dependent Clp endopeptidase proteolytic subunit ClpP